MTIEARNASHGNCRFWQWTSAAALVAQLGMLSFWRNAFGPYVTPLIHFAALLVPGVSLIVVSARGAAKGSVSAARQRARFVEMAAPLAVTAAGALVVGSAAPAVFAAYPIDTTRARGSDILLMITVMVRRFVGGEYPYARIQTEDYSFPPSYMPFQWLPFIGAEMTSIDYRWIPFAVLTAAILAYEISVSRSAARTLVKWTLAVVPFALWRVFLAYDPAIAGVTAEPLIAGYYLLLSLALLGSSNGLKVLSLIVCLMSRYSVVLWVPLYLWIVWLRDKRRAVVMGAAVFAGGLLIYGPFLLHDPGLYRRTYEYYTTATLAEWNPPGYPAGTKPYHLFQGLGFAVYFYELIQAPVERRIALLQSTHLAVSLLCVLALGIVFLRLRGRVDEPSFLLASLSIYFAFFYAFIQIPYAYLYLVPLFVSCAVLYRVMTVPAADVRTQHATAAAI